MWEYGRNNGKKGGMRFFLLAAAAVLLAFCFTGCSTGKEEEEDNSLPAEYYDIVAEKRGVFKAESSKGGMFLGMQYYNGEIIQLRTEQSDVYLYHEDGTRELLAENMPGASQLLWYLDSEGNRYCWEQDFMLSAVNGQDKKENYSILKTDSSGKELYHIQLDGGIKPVDICQLTDGGIALLLENQAKGTREVAELNPVTGQITLVREIKLLSTGLYHIAAGSQGLLVLDKGVAAGIFEVMLEDGKQLSNQSFASGSYSMGAEPMEMEVQDFCIQEDGSVEILWADPETAKGVCETLRLKKIEKIPVVIATPYIIDSWMMGKITEFNKSNETYHVIPQCGNNVNYGEFATRLQLEVTTGKGPDILYEDGIWGLGALVEKGGFEDLTPYMESSGVKEEDYFPSAFSYWRDGEKIYTASLDISSGYSYIRADVMGGEEPENIQEFLEGMLGWEDGEILEDYWGLSGDLLTGCLDSDDMQGMIDWEKGTCNFGGELFLKMMEYARRYGIHTREEALKYHGKIIENKYTANVYSYGGYAEYTTTAEMKEQGWVRYSPMFDDGIHPITAATYPRGVLAINANSDHKQGAWEFICFMMSENVQKTNPNCSVNRNVFMSRLNGEIKDAVRAEIMQQMLEETDVMDSWDEEETDVMDSWDEIEEMLTEERIAEYMDMHEEDIAEYLSLFEEGRDLSMQYLKMQPILDIIEEESVYYFTDVKSAEEVIEVINNRVQLYLDER